jgi:glucan-binding YG repeat protein
MFKRSTKITSLIVAAASVASMVPAMAATTKVEEKDGTIYHAVAYKDGTFYIGGDVDEKGDGAFYLKDGKYSELDDIDSDDEAKLFSDKYVNFEDDAYLDLSTGKVSDDDDLAEDSFDDATSKLSKQIKKDDPSRYTMNDGIGGDGKPSNIQYVTYGNDEKELPGNYMEPWYEFLVQSKNADGLAVDNATKDANGNYYNTVFADNDGNYIDADHDLGSIKVVATTGDAVITIKNTKDSEKSNDKKWEADAKIVDSYFLAQDADNIYRMVSLDITLKDLVNNVEYKNYDLFFGGKKDLVKMDGNGYITAIQKISKASDGDVDDAKLPKSQETYFFAEYKDYESGKGEKLAELREVLAGDTDYSGWSVVDGKLINYRLEDGGDNFKAQTLSLKSKAGFNYLDKDDADFDINDRDEFDVSIDKDGQLWALDNGKVKLYKDGFDTVYKVDGAMNALSVYDKDNLIAWNEDEDIYCIVGGKSSTDSDVVEPETPAVTTGWVQDATTGSWSYVKADGTKAIGWLQSPASGVWYYMDATGTMMTNGWIQDAGKWYFVDATGAMKTGWVYTGGAWYYLASNGAMQTGWVQTGGKWYYCNASGAMLSNTTVDGYVLGADGAWIK